MAGGRLDRRDLAKSLESFGWRKARLEKSGEKFVEFRMRKVR